MSMIREINKDIFSNNCEIMIHAVSYIGVMDGGLSSRIRERFPDHYANYQYAFQSVPTGRPELLLGHFFITKTTAPYDIGAIFAYGTGAVAYDKLAVGLYAFARRFDSLAIPQGMCAGPGGKNWAQVMKLIKNVANEYPSCKFKIYNS